MSGGRIGFGARPVVPEPTPDAWVRRGEASPAKAELYTARLTVDITPELRGRIKIAAFRRGVTMAVLLRELLETSFAGEERP
ncbi:plasmid segregation centromere-binding protein ParG [Azospirillum oryzae]|uniref:Plasmid segregation centromere-binding protein ParG n=1 Tax=Azospirillum oryzae TaxID=286727 RepID=A0A1X7EL09_9PROT|nr:MULTISPECIES: chromosome partitioning protein ParB [Azospirillum]QCG95792.1 chromosome partitioning protein ParB [Azospirillum sp. TSA2s]SMF35320.1 plasmid segregation centromere-binding protein ParG [Azospirillum oryzae]